MVVSTYQAASGAGAAAMEELELQTREVWIKLCLYNLLDWFELYYWDCVKEKVVLFTVSNRDFLLAFLTERCWKENHPLVKYLTDRFAQFRYAFLVIDASRITS